MNNTHAYRALKAASKALTDLGVYWWVDCGTLLGLVREGGFLSHDLDVDVSCFEPDRHQEIHRAMLQAGFKAFRRHGSPERGYEQRYQYQSVRLDIFYFYEGTIRQSEPVEDEELCWQGSYDEHNRLIVSEFPRDIVRETKAVEFQGLNLPVPVEFEAMLICRYDEWWVEKRKWDWRTDPFCITEIADPVPDTKASGLEDVTFLVKTFLRPELAIRAVKSIRDTYGNCPVVVVDDSHMSVGHEQRLTELGARLLRLPYDSGLSAGRNAGIREIDTTYTVYVDDDIVVTDDSRVPQMLSLLEWSDVVCGAIRQNKRVIRWEGHYQFPEDKGLVFLPYNGDYQRHQGIRWAYVDFGLNVLAARTEFLREHPWDEDLKLVEHTDWFLRLRGQARVVHALDCIFEHRPERKPEYRHMRIRREFRLRFFHKHGFSYHVGYSGHKDVFTASDRKLAKALLEAR